jgi:hypothetical protein
MQTGEVLGNKNLVDNINLRRLINDFVEEGGLGLYSNPSTTDVEGPRRALVIERMLILQCVESTTPGQAGVTYRVGQGGAEGGRTRKSDAIDRHFVQVFHVKNFCIFASLSSSAPSF